VKHLYLAVFTSLIAISAEAGAPPFDTAAPVAYMVDLSSGAVLYAKDADRRIPPASMAKMMTMYVAFDLIKQGKYKMDQEFSVRPETWEKWHGPAAGSTMFLSPGEKVSIRNLLHGISTLSGNDACVVMAEGMFGTESAFVARMNESAAKLGLSNTHYGTSNGWPDEGKTYTSARDLAKLARATLEHFPAEYKEFAGAKDFTWGKTNGGKAIVQPNRNPILGKIEGADGIKTGHTEEAGYGFTGSAEQKGRRLVMVVAGLDSFNGRITESVKFMDWGYKAWETKPVAVAGKTVGEAPVQMGNAASVSLVTPRPVMVSMPTGTAARYTVSLAYNGPIKAPIKKGEHVADLLIKVEGLPAQSTPLVAAQDVAEGGFFGRAWAGLMSFF
jgi:serine-type D-Ala-D-Ala carboxypeptidase (penicillin-binding protein 5/6)